MPTTVPARRTKRLSPELFELVKTMQKRWPKAINIAEPKPLAIGVHHQIQQELDLEPEVLRQLMQWYTRRSAYRQALATSEHRYHLDGTIAGPVQLEERPSANAQTPSKPTSGKPAVAVSTASAKARFTWKEVYANKESLMADAMTLSADLKLVLRQMPVFHTSEDGTMLYCAFNNTPSGVPAELAMGQTPLYLALRVKAWNKALKRVEKMKEEGAPSVIFIIEAAVSVGDKGALMAYGKGIQVIAGKAKEAAQS